MDVPDNQILGMEKKHKLCFRSIQDMIPARAVLYLMSFSGFLVSFMMRTDINIAMVAMAKMRLRSENSSNSTELYCYTSVTNGTQSFKDQKLMEEGEFDWDSTVQSAILGSFYWCYILSQVVGGVLTQRFGTKTVFGFSQLTTGIASLLIPQAASLHFSAVIVLRSVQGMASGLTWPAMYALVGIWIPSNERTRFMSSFQGFSFGIGLTYMVCGFIIGNYGWRVVFYMNGSLGVAWCLLWWLLAFDLPHKHPRITRRELNYINANIGENIINTKDLKVPWCSIMTSIPAWSIGITTFGRIWVHYTFIIYGPSYMKTILGFSIQKNGFMNGAPFLCSYLSSVVFCYAADFIIARNLMSLTNVRKMFTAISQVIPGLLVLIIGYLGCQITLILIIWFVAVTLITASYAGAMANVVDIAPNFAGHILAFAQTIHMSASFLSPLATAIMLQDNPTLERWRRIFAVTACVACGTYVMYQFGGTAKEQVWNNPNRKNNSGSVRVSPENNQLIVNNKTDPERGDG
ncbi:hypothetical protein QTP88_018285 [Uroleucon formosanum]